MTAVQLLGRARELARIDQEAGGDRSAHSCVIQAWVTMDELVDREVLHEATALVRSAAPEIGEDLPVRTLQTLALAMLRAQPQDGLSALPERIGERIVDADQALGRWSDTA